MAGILQVDRKNYNIIAKYRDEVESLGIRVKKIILFGSHASGIADESSDLDLVVISDDFKGMGIWERLCLLGEARIEIKKPMEILGLTEEEFEPERKGSFIGDEVKLKGIEIK